MQEKLFAWLIFFSLYCTWLSVLFPTGFQSSVIMLYYNFVCKTGGTIVLFDRKMLRNFRKDGHNWKKKTDGKTVKEAHEHLKVRILNFVGVYLKLC